MTRAFKVAGEAVIVRVSGLPDKRLQLDFLSKKPTGAVGEAIREQVIEWFDLQTDLAAFYKMAAGDSVLAPLITRHYGLRLLRIHNLFQALCWAILGQQVNLAFAYTLYRRFIETFGERIDPGETGLWHFPLPETIAQLAVRDLMRLQNTRRKSEYIIGVAKAIVAGELCRADLLRRQDSEDVRRTLVNIRGVGPWTASYVMMRCLGTPTAFPIQDIGLHNALKQLLKLETKPDMDEIREMAQGWRGWEAYATFYLYRSLL